jgi:mannose/fructose-specific phosphotransferase system component IIA
MSEDVIGILVGHGKLAEGLLDAVERITGSREGITPVDNVGLTPEALEQRLDELAGGGPAVVFVDLPSGSCAFAARRLKLQRPGMAVVCGVNLPLLLDFVFQDRRAAAVTRGRYDRIRDRCRFSSAGSMIA